MNSRIQAQPTDGLSYDPNEPKYWERASLDKEVERVFDICQGCRLCFNLCPSFPTMFDSIDANEGDVRALTGAEKQRVVDLCYDCKLCEVKCPYTPAEGHPFQLDFPRLMLRVRAINAADHGIKLRDRILSDPQRLGKLTSRAPGLTNWSCRTAFPRLMMEKLLGIHRDKKLPELAGETFEHWLSRNGLPAAPAEPAAKVAIFHTCLVNYFNPAPAQAAVAVLARNGCQMASPAQNCCGMPALETGDVALARKLASSNVTALTPLVRDGYRIAVINPTCSLMMREEYPVLLGGAQAQEVGAAVADLHEVLDQLRRAGRFNRDFRSTPTSIAYHVPCHLKAQGIGMCSRDLMRTIPGVTITTVDACSAHDGSWAMKKEFFELSMRWGKRAFDGMTEAGARLMVTDCSLAAIQIEQGTGVRPIHPIEVLARAYEPDGFPDAIAPPPTGLE